MRSIFDGWDRETLTQLYGIVTGSPTGLVALVALLLIFVLLVVLIGLYVSHRVSGFYIRIQQEEEDARREEEEREAEDSREDADRGDDA